MTVSLFSPASPAARPRRSAGATTTEHDSFAFSRRNAPEFCISLPLQMQEGAGKTGCALHPRSHGQCASRKCAHEHTGSAVNTPASPTQWLYGLYVVVLVTGFLATIIIGSFRLRRLDASTGASDPHDFAVRICRARQSRPCVHRIPPHGRDDRDRPSCRRETGEIKHLICPTTQTAFCPSCQFVAIHRANHQCGADKQCELRADG